MPSESTHKINRAAARAAELPRPEERVIVSGVDALAAVIALYGPTRLLGRGEKRASDHALRAAVHQLVEEARQTDTVRVERLLIELRRAWRAMPAIQRLPADGPGGDLWDRLVLLCCEEFYVSNDTSRTGNAQVVAHAI
jgi:hypothetical protein